MASHPAAAASVKNREQVRMSEMSARFKANLHFAAGDPAHQLEHRPSGPGDPKVASKIQR